MAKRRRKGFVSDKQRKKVMLKLKGEEYRREDDFESITTYPDNHNIKMPTSSPTFSITKLDEALDYIFKKKKR